MTRYERIEVASLLCLGDVSYSAATAVAAQVSAAASASEFDTDASDVVADGVVADVEEADDDELPVQFALASSAALVVLDLTPGWDTPVVQRTVLLLVVHSQHGSPSS